MTALNFTVFFKTATAGQTPYAYQRRLACGEQVGRPEADGLTAGTPCTSQLISIPTGIGKTAAVVLS